MSRPRAHLSAALALAVAAGSASAQTFTWDNSAGGSWFAPLNWSPSGVPNGAGAEAVLDLGGAYAANIDAGNVTLDTLSITHQGAQVGVLNNRVLAIGGGIASSGEIVVNPTSGGSATYLQILDSISVTGNGTIRLNATANVLDRAYIWYSDPAFTLTNGASHTIAGAGNIYTRLDNQGLVSADVSGGILQLFSQPKSNSGVMQAVGGGELRIAGIAIDQTGGGLIDAPDVGGNPGLIRLQGATILGGDIREQDTNPIEAVGTVRFTNTELEGRLNIVNNSNLQIDGDELIYDGSITVNSSSGGSATYIQFNQPATTLGAPGSEIVLNATGGVLDRAYLWYGNPANIATSVQGHTIRGSGNIYVSLANDGLVSADVEGALLRLATTPKTNSGTMQAVNGAVLYIDGIAVNQTASAQILAPDGGATPNEIRFAGATIAAGQIIADGTSTIEIAGTSSINNPAITGTLNIQNNQSLQVLGDQLDHEGTITVNSTSGGSATFIQFNQPFTTLGPTGAEVVLNATANVLDRAYLWYGAAANVVHNVAGHTIRGSGNIYTNTVNDGLIQADVSGGILRLANTKKTNNNQISAIDGATIQVHGITIDQTAGGRLTADPAGGDPASLQFASATILGGEIEASGGSRSTLTGSSAFHNVDFAGPTDIPNNITMILRGDETTFADTVTINSSTGGSATLLNIDALAHEINGAGPIVLNASGGVLDRAYLWYSDPANVLTLKTPVEGSGNIYTNTIIETTISANRPGETLQLLGQPKTNRGSIVAENGANLSITGITLTQESPGNVTATDASTLSLSGATIIGGPIDAEDGRVDVVGSSTLTNVDLSGPLNIPNNSRLTITETITNDGTILINSSAGGSATYMARAGGAVTLDGDGVVVLNATGGILDRAYLWYGKVAEDILTVGPDQTIAGHGNMYGNFVIEGTLSPGHALASAGEIGRVGISNGAVNLEPTALVEFQVAGSQPAQYDHFTGNSAFECAGTLRAEINGWTPGACEIITLIEATGGVSGRFDSVILPPDPQPGRSWRLFYTPSTVEMRLTCYADFDGTCTLDIFDFLAFQDAFVSMDPEADCDGNTLFNIFDFLCFQDAFVQGCN